MDAKLLLPRYGDDAFVDITVYLFDKDGHRPMTIVTQAVRLVGKEECVWVFWQPKIPARLGLSFEGPIPEGAFQMYHHDLGLWTALPEPTRPILVLPGRALLWRRTGVSNMPELESWMTLTSHNATPIPDIPNLPSRIEPFFSRKSLATGSSVKNAIGLLTSPNKSSQPRTPRKRTGRAQSLILTPRSHDEEPSVRARTAPIFRRLPSSTLSSPSRAQSCREAEPSSPAQSQPVSSSPPAPSQVLRDVFGDDWKTVRRTTSNGNAIAGPSTLKRAASSDEQDTPSKCLKCNTARGTPATGGAPKKPCRRFVPPPDVIELSSDEEEIVIVVPKKYKGKGKAKERKPIPADADIIEISD